VSLLVSVLVLVRGWTRVFAGVETIRWAGVGDVPVGREDGPSAAAPPASEADAESLCEPVELEVDEDSSSAQAIGLADTAAPIPKATANAPTRPT